MRVQGSQAHARDLRPMRVRAHARALVSAEKGGAGCRACRSYARSAHAHAHSSMRDPVTGDGAMGGFVGEPVMALDSLVPRLPPCDGRLGTRPSAGVQRMNEGV